MQENEGLLHLIKRSETVPELISNLKPLPTQNHASQANSFNLNKNFLYAQALSQDSYQATTSHRLRTFIHIWEKRIPSYKTIWMKIFRPHVKVKHEPQKRNKHTAKVFSTHTCADAARDLEAVGQRNEILFFLRNPGIL